VTHDPHGGYDHPDHVVTYRAVTGAFYASGVMGAHAPERLFYTAIERETFRTLSEVSRGKGPGGGLDPDVFGTAHPMIAVSFDARTYMDVKLAAMAAHRSQFGLTLETVHNPPPFAAEMMAALRPVLQREAFTLGAARGPIARWPLSDFFDGLETEGISAEAEELVAGI
jgi:N-acetyl-1-D-myo-inositol-2-amino-2-deoxy-alpha-D-glucopyranoside deacetylase